MMLFQLMLPPNLTLRLVRLPLHQELNKRPQLPVSIQPFSLKLKQKPKHKLRLKLPHSLELELPLLLMLPLVLPLPLTHLPARAHNISLSRNLTEELL